MRTKLILFRNELKNKTIPTYKMIGIVSELLLSKEIFRTNAELEEFLSDVCSLHFKSYVFRSRTLLVARTIREIMNIKDDLSLKAHLYSFIQQLIEKYNEDDNTKNQFNGWIGKGV